MADNQMPPCRVTDSGVPTQRAVQFSGARLLQCVVSEGRRTLHADALQVAGRHCSGCAGLCVSRLSAGELRQATSFLSTHEQLEPAYLDAHHPT